MKGAVVYDSVYGNTKLVAEAIAEQIRADGHSAELLNLRADRRRQIDADFVFIGGPTRMKKMTRNVKGFINRLDKSHWSTRPLVAFDTYGPLGKTEEERKKGEKWINPGAVGGIQALASKMGLKVHPASLRCAVTDMKGPLEPTALEHARKFTHEFAMSLGT
ncbi:MAG: flavodoxin domain-containing protein [Thermoplasmatota archaeon]|nr:flavodoxin domain-containing protein [Candidatus Thermoplasmatota archaeon]